MACFRAPIRKSGLQCSIKRPSQYLAGKRCEAHSLILCTDYKDCDVRDVDVVGPGGTKCQVWIDPPEHDGVTVRIWPYAPPHERLTVHIEDIAAALEHAYDLAARFVNGKAV
jgi:hypothetical protein